MFKISRRTAIAAATCLLAASTAVSAAELTGTLKKVQETGSITLGSLLLPQCRRQAHRLRLHGLPARCGLRQEGARPFEA